MNPSKQIGHTETVGGLAVDRHTPRRPWLAAIASLALPGLGQFYNARVDRALWIFIVFSIVSIPLLATIALYAPVLLTTPLLALCVLASLAIWIGSIIDAWRDARRLATDPSWRRRPWQTGSAYATIVVLCNALCLPLAIDWVRSHQAQPFRLPSASMTPTLLPGDYVFADMSYNCPGCRRAVARDDIAIFVYPNDRTRYYVKRIVALPGERVDIADDGIRVEGKLVERRVEDGVEVARVSSRPLVSPRSLTVPSGSVFVLGDNRDASNDSRSFDAVPLRDVVGKVRQIWFSIGPDGVRWSRLGLLPR